MGVRADRVEIFPSGEIGIVWEDGREDYFTARELRLACPCAGCVDELTGVRTLDPASVPERVRALSSSAVGHYAVHFRFSDVHESGIFSFEYLRRLGEQRHA